MSENKKEGGSDYYFDSYSHYGIHEEMLKDHIRTGSYRDAILNNKQLFKDKVVLDVGCGTGILSMFAAKAGAKKVIGIDMSTVVVKAKQIVKDNGFEDKIEIIKGKVEEVELPVKEVDIIISEWMGYFLLYESMLDTVLYARDKWLKPDGYVLPDKLTMHICGIEDSEYKSDKVDHWDNVYGFNFGAMKHEVLCEPLVDFVDRQQVITSVDTFFTIDVATIKASELKDFTATFSIKSKYREFCHAYVSWFDVVFSRGLHKDVKFTTGPFGRQTHWKQTVFYLEEDLPLKEDDEVKGTIRVSQNKKNHRDLDISLTFNINEESPQSQDFILR